MKVEATIGCMICVPYQLKKQNNSLIVTNKDCDNIAKIVDSNMSGFVTDDIVVYNKKEAKEFVVDNTTYISLRYNGVLALIREEEEE